MVVARLKHCPASRVSRASPERLSASSRELRPSVGRGAVNKDTATSGSARYRLPLSRS
jgi:hypothetical protein